MGFLGRKPMHELTMMTTSVGTRAETQVHEQMNTSSPIDAEWWAVEDGVSLICIEV